ncbi:response regulator [Lichenifustis flavocetrariae]|uniref:histidine kinase n=1 Tax=Lichenifustis flavocetrariae TaxID=2949735 RepID=A0AA42CJE3_9HYPH|nr:response regulator [Lichenifustis flavocetrariae]MCW6507981.1 response regulator [Lichenifustis flavocetrariae]
MVNDGGGDADASGAFRRFRGSNGPALVLLVLAIVLGSVSAFVAWRDSAEIERNTAFTIRLERLLSDLKDLETGQRGFLLTGEDRYLDPYNAANALLDGQARRVQEMGFPIGDLIDLVNERRASAARGIGSYRKDGAATALSLVRNGRGKTLMDAVRAQVGKSQDEADARIAAFRRDAHVLAVPMAAIALLAMAVAFAILVTTATRRRRAQQASAALLEGVLDNAPVGLGFLDATLHVRQMNRSLRTMSERALSAVIGQSIWEVMPQMREALEARVRTVVSGGRPIQNLDVQAVSNAHPDQTRHYQVSFYPLHRVGAGNSNDIEGAGMVVLDVTARKRSEQRLRESEERFRTLTESVASIVWLMNGAGEFDKPQVEWAAFTGQEFVDHQGTGWTAAIHPADVEEVKTALAHAIASRTPYKIEHRIRRLDGAWRYVDAHAVPISDEGGHVREWIGSSTDITARKEAELELAAAKEAAESANRAKSVFLANMSHELRTPLSAVIGYSEMMEEEVEDLGVESLKTDLGKIKSNARHLLSLINDVLDLSKIEANRMDVFAEEIDVGILLRDVVSTVGALVHKKNNVLSLTAPPDLGMMRTDGVKLRQCLFNLLSNASKFTENGQITLEAVRSQRGTQDWLEFRVVDSGIGMSPEQVDRLFERFTQADETTTRKFGGTGLGLAITRAFCRLLGGDIRVQSVAGEGSTFIMTLPAEMPHLSSAPDGEIDASPSPHPRARETILIIDDDPAQRDLMSRFLERQGFTVATAPDGQTGLDLARVLEPRAILLDVMMPRMDGWSVLTTLKADPELAKIPVVMVTFVHDTGMGAALGAADYVTKPVHWDKLKIVMDRFRDAEGDVLIVDDDADARARLKSVLERNGWTTQEAENGKEALALVSRVVPRVILLDLTMPVMDGFSFLEELRERPGCRDVPVVVLTARDLTAGDRDRLEGADRIFSKGQVSLTDITRELRALAPPQSEPERAEEPLL